MRPDRLDLCVRPVVVPRRGGLAAETDKGPLGEPLALAGEPELCFSVDPDAEPLSMDTIRSSNMSPCSRSADP